MARNRTVNPKLNLRLNPRPNLHGLTTLPLMAYPVAVHATRLAPFNLGGSVGNTNRTPVGSCYSSTWLLPASRWTPVPSIWSCVGVKMRRHL